MKKIKNTRSKTKAPSGYDCSSVIQAENKTEIRREIILALKAIPTLAFHPSGRINSAQLLKDAAAHPDIVKKFEDVPDIRLEKALTARAVRKESEIRVEQALKEIAPIDVCRRILTQGGAMVRGKLMSIPDRVSEWCALETDGAKIRDRLITELSDALQALSEQPVEKLIKDILANR